MDYLTIVSNRKLPSEKEDGTQTLITLWFRINCIYLKFKHTLWRVHRRIKISNGFCVVISLWQPLEVVSQQRCSLWFRVRWQSCKNKLTNNFCHNSKTCIHICMYVSYICTRSSPYDVARYMLPENVLSLLERIPVNFQWMWSIVCFNPVFLLWPCASIWIKLSHAKTTELHIVIYLNKWSMLFLIIK